MLPRGDLGVGATRAAPAGLHVGHTEKGSLSSTPMLSVKTLSAMVRTMDEPATANHCGSKPSMFPKKLEIQSGTPSLLNLMFTSAVITAVLRKVSARIFTTLADCLDPTDTWRSKVVSASATTLSTTLTRTTTREARATKPLRTMAVAAKLMHKSSFASSDSAVSSTPVCCALVSVSRQKHGMSELFVKFLPPVPPLHTGDFDSGTTHMDAHDAGSVPEMPDAGTGSEPVMSATYSPRESPGQVASRPASRTMRWVVGVALGPPAAVSASAEQMANGGVSVSTSLAAC
mmetsp:Transcript_11635/g.45234  ORF Transcript_11635/g.45234 Transcript_11635/m.45234 type:complete len:288 (-) Transcript_11635:1140-2003(-)